MYGIWNACPFRLIFILIPYVLLLTFELNSFKKLKSSSFYDDFDQILQVYQYQCAKSDGGTFFAIEADI